jgi:hypothetical protein
MENIKNFNSFIFESQSSDMIDEICKKYSELKEVKNKIFYNCGRYHNILIKIINRKILSKDKPEWEMYMGSHHWGKKTSYIPENEIWISSDLDENNFRKILNHEIIEREMMRALQEEKGMTAKTSWEQAHYSVKRMSF